MSIPTDDTYSSTTKTSPINAKEIDQLYRDLIYHGEQHFGYFEHFWGEDENGPLGFLICKYITFESTEDEPLYAYVTVGLSVYDYLVEGKSGSNRHEYILLSSENYGADEDPIAGVLSTLGKMEVEDLTAYNPGEIIDLVEYHTPYSQMSKVYIMSPMWLPAEATVLPTLDDVNDTTKLRWVVPLHDEEATLADVEGAASVIQLLEETQPDVSDFGRLSEVAYEEDDIVDDNTVEQ